MALTCRPHVTWRSSYTWRGVGRGGVARTIDGVLIETIPPANQMAMRAISSVTDYSGGVSIASMLTTIDAALANKALCIPVFHRFATVATATTVCSWAAFDTFLAGLSSRNVPPRVLSDVLR